MTGRSGANHHNSTAREISRNTSVRLCERVEQRCICTEVEIFWERPEVAGQNLAVCVCDCEVPTVEVAVCANPDGLAFTFARVVLYILHVTLP